MAPDQSASIHHVAPASATGSDTCRRGRRISRCRALGDDLERAVRRPARHVRHHPGDHGRDLRWVVGLEHEPVPARGPGQRPFTGRDRHDPDRDPRRLDRPRSEGHRREPVVRSPESRTARPTRGRRGCRASRRGWSLVPAAGHLPHRTEPLVVEGPEADREHEPSTRQVVDGQRLARQLPGSTARRREHDGAERTRLRAHGHGRQERPRVDHLVAADGDGVVREDAVPAGILGTGREVDELRGRADIDDDAVAHEHYLPSAVRTWSRAAASCRDGLLAGPLAIQWMSASALNHVRCRLA